MTQETQPEHPDPIGDDEQSPGGDGNGDEGFDPKEVEQDPAHEPEQEGLKDLKGG
jgi:hypothetical protein